MAGRWEPKDQRPVGRKGTTTGEMDMRMIGLLLLTVLLSGCMGQVRMMKNDQGDVKKCEITGSEQFWAGGIMASRMMTRCMEQYEKFGYKSF